MKPNGEARELTLASPDNKIDSSDQPTRSPSKRKPLSLRGC